MNDNNNNNTNTIQLANHNLFATKLISPKNWNNKSKFLFYAVSSVQLNFNSGKPNWKKKEKLKTMEYEHLCIWWNRRYHIV